MCMDWGQNFSFLVAKLVHSFSHCWRNLKPLQLSLHSAAIEVLRGEKKFRCLIICLFWCSCCFDQCRSLDWSANKHPGDDSLGSCTKSIWHDVIAKDNVSRTNPTKSIFRAETSLVGTMSLWIAMWPLDFMGSNLQGNIPPFRSLMKPFRDFLNKILMNLWMFARCSDIVFWKVMKIHEGFSCLKARLVNKISVNALASVFAQKFSLEASKHWISGWIWHPLWCDGRHGCLFVWRPEYLVYLVRGRCGRMVTWFRSILVSVCTIRAEITYLWKILQTKCVCHRPTLHWNLHLPSRCLGHNVLTMWRHILTMVSNETYEKRLKTHDLQIFMHRKYFKGFRSTGPQNSCCKAAVSENLCSSSPSPELRTMRWNPSKAICNPKRWVEQLAWQVWRQIRCCLYECPGLSALQVGLAGHHMTGLACSATTLPPTSL